MFCPNLLSAGVLTPAFSFGLRCRSFFNLCSSVAIGLKQNHLPYNKQNRILKFFKRRKISWYEKIALKKDISGPSGVGTFSLTLLILSPDAYSLYRTSPPRPPRDSPNSDMQGVSSLYFPSTKRNGLNTT